MNPGGHFLLGVTIRSLFARPVIGAVADALGAALVVAGTVLAVRAGRRALTLVGAALVVGGWAGNLLDRLGLHSLTAPGSRRGAIDFIPTGLGYRGNLADVFIGLGVVLLVGGRLAVRAVHGMSVAAHMSRRL